MIAINWFEVLLPTATFHVPVSPVPSERPRTRDQWIRQRGEKLYHISETVPDGAAPESLDFQEEPALGKLIIEKGFGTRLREVGFSVRYRRVGGVAYKASDRSLRPKIYEALVGVRFRCFYLGRKGHRSWGLVLSYVTGQRFCVSLRDAHLRQMALGKRVIRFQAADQEGDSKSPVLDRVDGAIAVVVDEEGNELSGSLEEWTLPCRRDFLSSYFGRTEGSEVAQQIAIRLQQDALALTPDRRMNIKLARDQVDRLRKVLDGNGLDSFRLALPDPPMVRLSPRPLLVNIEQ